MATTVHIPLPETEESLEEQRNALNAYLLESMKDADKAFEIPQDVLDHGNIVGYIREQAKHLR